MTINNKILKIRKINTSRDYIDIDQLCEILLFILNKKITKTINIGSGKKLNLVNLIKLIMNKKNIKKKLIFENKEYPGFFANISLLRKLGYRKKIYKFKF